MIIKVWIQSGAATLLRQGENILDFAEDNCGRSNHVLGFVNKHRVHLLMQASSCCQLMQIWTYHWCPLNGLCATARFNTTEENLDASWCSEGLDRLRLFNRCLTSLDHLNFFWPGNGECISSTSFFFEMAFFSKLPFAVTNITSLCLVCQTHLSPPSSCDAKNQLTEVRRFQRTHIWQN